MQVAMKRHVLFVFLMLLFMSTFLLAIQKSDDSLDEPLSTPSTRRRSGCPPIRNLLKNGWVKMRSRGRIAKFFCNKGFQLIGSRTSTCVRAKWNNPFPVCVDMSTFITQTPITSKNIGTTHAEDRETNGYKEDTKEEENRRTNSKTTIETMLVTTVIDLNAMSEQSVSLSADDNKTVDSQIVDDTNKSGVAFNSSFTSSSSPLSRWSTPTNSISHVSTLATTPTPISPLNTITISDVNAANALPFISQMTTKKLESGVSSILTRDADLQDITTIESKVANLSADTSTSTVSSVSTVSTVSQVSSVSSARVTSTMVTSLESKSETATESELESSKGKVQAIIESKTTAAKPITTESSIWKCNDSVTRMNQTIAMNATTAMPDNATHHHYDHHCQQTDEYKATTIAVHTTTLATTLSTTLKAMLTPMRTTISSQTPTTTQTQKQIPIATQKKIITQNLEQTTSESNKPTTTKIPIKLTYKTPKQAITQTSKAVTTPNTTEMPKQTTTYMRKKVTIETSRQTIESNSFIKHSTQSLQKTTIIPIIRTMSTTLIAWTERRRRKSGTKSWLSSLSSATSSLKPSVNKLQTTLTIVIPVILTAIIVFIVSLYFIRMRKTILQAKLSEDSEMLYLSSTEIG